LKFTGFGLPITRRLAAHWDAWNLMTTTISLLIGVLTETTHGWREFERVVRKMTVQITAKAV